MNAAYLYLIASSWIFLLGWIVMRWWRVRWPFRAIRPKRIQFDDRSVVSCRHNRAPTKPIVILSAPLLRAKDLGERPRVIALSAMTITRDANILTRPPT